MTAEEDKSLARVMALEEKHTLHRERSLKIDGHHLTLDRLEDVLEAVVTGAVNIQHAAFLLSKIGLSRIASFEYT
jgi:hypothetical protein